MLKTKNLTFNFASHSPIKYNYNVELISSSYMTRLNKIITVWLFVQEILKEIIVQYELYI